MAKAPMPGRVKTRLCPPCTAEEAALVAEAALVDTLAAALASSADRVVLALDGRPGPWLPAGVDVVSQRGSGFAERLAAAWGEIGGPALQIGMDTPQVTPALLDLASAALDAPDTDAVLGPAEDGGWWTIGLRRADPAVFVGVPMSRPDTGARQMARLRELGLRTATLPALARRRHHRRCPRRGRAGAGHSVRGRCQRSRRSRRMIASLATSPPVLRTAEGDVIPLLLDRWQASPPLEEAAVLARAVGPVLDVGCGPGRHTQALAERGTIALGIDTSPSAVDAAHERGCPVLRRSVFDPLPREGRWRSAFLIDGNIGIGGDAPRLLRRLRQVLAGDGRVLAEVEPPGLPTVVTCARVEHGDHRGPWFPWARVGIDGIDAIARAAGLRTTWTHAEEGRWFVQLTS